MSVERKSESTADALLAIVQGLIAESRPGYAVQVALSSRLERDLGLDSLARVELISRIEDGFRVELPSETLSRAETLQDLLDALNAAGGVHHVTHTHAMPAHAVQANLARVEGFPTEAATLVDVLDWHVRAHPDRTHVLYYETPERTVSMSYGELQRAALAIAAGLQRRGLARGQSVAIMLPTCLEFFHCYYGILLAGGVPVPLYPPARLSQLEDHLRRQIGILASCLAPVLITIPEAKIAARFLRAESESLREVVTPADLESEDGAACRPMALAAEEVAFIQYTSGSTGNPKGVVLTHANLLANVRAWGRGVRLDSADVVVSWLPLYHDMGLIGAWLGSLYHASLLVLMSPLDFLARPERWLWAIHTHRGTVTAAPNFAYEMCLRRLHEDALQGLDLSTWRLAANGAEPVSAATLERFAARFAPHGFRAEAMAPVYGLAECTVGLAIPPMGRAPVIDRVRRSVLQESGRAEPVSTAESDIDVDAATLAIVGCGHPLIGHQVRIVDEDGRELPDRSVGHLQFRGPSATSGYLRNEEETRRLLRGDWLDSGDLAYIAGGEIFLTSRAKDMIIRGGRNIYPYELEEAVGRLAGVRKGCVAVFGAPDHAAGTERLVVVAETAEQGGDALTRLRGEINRLAVELVGTATDDIVLARPQSVLKTSSGKIRRAGTRERYLAGAIAAPGAQGASAWMQVVRVTWMGMTPGLRRMARRIREIGFAARVYVVFAMLAPLAWLGAVLLPRAAWSITRALARAMLALAGYRVSVQGLAHLPRGTPCVAVSNHASYLDGVLVLAALPEPFGFVAKGELERQFFARRFLRALGAQFVERFDIERSVEDTGRLTDRARAGQSLFVFAEGTLTRAPGLMAFRTGAFQIAAEAGLPVVPVTLTGTRSALRDGGWFPRRVPLAVSVAPVVQPTGSDWKAAVALRDAARTAILRRCGEPDLAQ